MSRTRIMNIVNLTGNGWRPYTGCPDHKVYERIGCELVLRKKRGKPFWFVRDDVFCCIGCGSNCTLKNPAGFVPPLPLAYPSGPKHSKYYLTPREMVEHHELLNAKQAAYCLNVSERTIYNYIAEGRLSRLKETPVRVRAADVKRLMENFDE